MEKSTKSPYKIKIQEQNAKLTGWQQFWKFMRVWDGIWAIPLAWVAFHIYEYWGYYRFGESFVPYDPAFFQAAIYAACMMVLANTLAFLGLYLNFRVVWRYWYIQVGEDFKSLSPLCKILITLIMYASYVATFIILLSILI